jgi:P-type Ca2+ transporter type 2C
MHETSTRILERNLAVAHAMEVAEVCAALGADQVQGLSSAESHARLDRVGPNRLPEAPRPTGLALIWRQLASPLIALLGLAAVVSTLAGEALDAFVIGAIVAVNAAIGYLQEAKGETAARSLQRLLAPMTRVVRDRTVSVVEAEELVPGDLVLLRAGDRVPADGRVALATDLEVNEASLTGESLPNAKRADPPVSADTPLADRATMVFAGTTVTRGTARLLVAATGAHTEVGRAVAVASGVRPPATPLQARLARFAALVLRAIGAVCLLLAVLAWAHGEQIVEALRVGVALAVAAVPEGLPAVLTVALAVGVQRMAQRNAIVRRLPAVETLGSTTVICTDKTGTLTEGRMSLGRIYVCSTGQERALGDGALGPAENELLGAAAIACQQQPGTPTLPDPATLAPTEAAIVAAARDHASARTPAGDGARVVRVEPFDSARKRMSVVVEEPERRRTAYVKGAPESVVPRLATDERVREALADRAAAWASEGARVLLVASRALADDGDPEAELEPLGLVGLLDPPRREIAAAVTDARRAGVRTVVVTGDHPGTAEAVARSVGIIEDGPAAVLTGADLDALGDAELEAQARSVSLFARVAPEHKVRIVGALERGGDVVAMTGDGVNDVPALEAAHIGVAMGRRGTDAAKDAADMVLADDDYSTIVAAIRRGRSIYDNVVRFVHFLVAANAGEVLAFTLAIAIGLPAPLTVVQILLVNLLTDGPPAVAVGVDPPRRGLMRRPPRPPEEPLLAPIRVPLLIGGVSTGVAAFVAFLLGYGENQATGQTMAFATLVFAQLAYVFAVRADGWPPVAGRNGFLYLAVGGSAVLVAVLLAARPLHEALDLVALDAAQLAVVAILAAIPFAALVSFKAWRVGESPAVEGNRDREP